MIVMELGVKPNITKVQNTGKNIPDLRRVMFADLTGSINGVAFDKNMLQLNDLKSGQVYLAKRKP